ncbi:nitrite/sulfite reductase [Domibacillus epiphyticus]|uniref:Ferredoxin--nitrite reductase n=1 Tax=Domibacillus epiphyticus TaxID=1714355 RepID=A0A1V2A8C6_9BACI|nr:ferredoxin--nitrite reductase [Domibacillus epiphyticus]OMP67243.1 ferredoxin--nitrite reductase [Domibacillus epiphyticus]
MAYEKVWANNEKLSKQELQKIERDWLEIFNDIKGYSQGGFDSIPKDQWDGFKWAGLYLQRPKEDGYFMMRVKVPSGIMSNEQLEALGGIARDYGRGVFDITTRQAIQFHWLTIEQIPDIFDRLDSVGLTSAFACGDVPRNVIGNPLAGIDPNETIDTTEIVKEVEAAFFKNPDFSNLPRKFKISVNANIYNAGNAEINDVAFIPAEKEIDGEVKQGFHLKVGGGLSSAPKLAKLLDLFVLPEQVVDVAKAVATIFRDHGYREKRHRARLKFLVEDWGPEKFLETLLLITGPMPTAGTDLTKGWNGSYFYGVHPQKQDGLSYVGVNVPVGRLDDKEVFEIARLAREYGNGEVRTVGTQNLIFPNVPTEKAEALLSESIFNRLKVNAPKFTAYSVSCTGIEYCNLALTETKERMKRVAAYLDENVDIDVPVRIHMVGCPNSCGQRQIADIGLQGVMMRDKDKKMIEAFEINVGGTLLDGGAFNEKLKGKIDGEVLPEVLREFLLYFKETKQPGETFREYFLRVGLDQLQSRLDELVSEKAAV